VVCGHGFNLLDAAPCAAALPAHWQHRP
jgi:hypothetical protein